MLEDRSHLMEPVSSDAAVDFSEIDGLLGDRARLIEHPQLGRTLEAPRHVKTKQGPGGRPAPPKRRIGRGWPTLGAARGMMWR